MLMITPVQNLQVYIEVRHNSGHVYIHKIMDSLSLRRELMVQSNSCCSGCLAPVPF